MASVNKVTLIGNVGETPEVRYLPDGTAVTTISLATTQKWKDKQTREQRERTEWHRVVLWGRLAEVVGEYVGKGKELYIEGENRTRSYEDKDGVKRYVTEVYAHEMQMTGNKAGSLPQAPNNDTPAPEAADLDARE